LKTARKGDCEEKRVSFWVVGQGAQSVIDRNSLLPLFSLTKKAQREKLGKRESAAKRISRVATRDKGCAPLIAQAFKKA
jgi:hypothetical protein